MHERHHGTIHTENEGLGTGWSRRSGVVEGVEGSLLDGEGRRAGRLGSTNGGPLADTRPSEGLKFVSSLLKGGDPCAQAHEGFHEARSEGAREEAEFLIQGGCPSYNDSTGSGVVERTEPPWRQ